MPFSTIFQLYRGGKFYGGEIWKKIADLKTGFLRIFF
jgi:hypothetical protein